MEVGRARREDCDFGYAVGGGRQDACSNGDDVTGLGRLR